MKCYWHFLKSNLLYNKVELSFSYGLTILVFCLYLYLQSIGSEAMTGMNFLSIAFYALLYAFFSNKKKFNLKYLVSLPMPKAEMLLIKACSDIVFFFPFICLGFTGVILAEFKVNPLAALVLLVQASVMASLFLFDSDVEEPRIENTRASFVNRLVFIRKKLDFVFYLGVVGIIGGVVFVSNINEGLAGLILVVLGFLAIGFKFFQSLKLLKDESLSYFVPKRDVFKMGWKLSVIAAPALFMYLNGIGFGSSYGNNDVFNSIVSNDLDSLKKFVESGKVKVVNGYTPLLVAAQEGNVEAFNLIFELGKSVNLNSVVSNKKLFGYGLAHLSALSNNLNMMERVLSIQTDALNLKTTQGKTPLMVAAGNCRSKMVDYLLHKGADPDVRSEGGDTALIHATRGGCNANVALLLEYGASVDVKNGKGKLALDYLSKNSSIRYLLERRMPKEYFEAKRSLASEEKR